MIRERKIKKCCSRNNVYRELRVYDCGIEDIHVEVCKFCSSEFPWNITKFVKNKKSVSEFTPPPRNRF